MNYELTKRFTESLFQSNEVYEELKEQLGIKIPVNLSRLAVKELFNCILLSRETATKVDEIIYNKIHSIVDENINLKVFCDLNITEDEINFIKNLYGGQIYKIKYKVGKTNDLYGVPITHEQEVVYAEFYYDHMTNGMKKEGNFREISSEYYPKNLVVQHFFDFCYMVLLAENKEKDNKISEYIKRTKKGDDVTKISSNSKIFKRFCKDEFEFLKHTIRISKSSKYRIYKIEFLNNFEYYYELFEDGFVENFNSNSLSFIEFEFVQNSNQITNFDVLFRKFLFDSFLEIYNLGVTKKYKGSLEILGNRLQ